MEKPITWYVDRQIALGKWRPVELSPTVTGLPCPVTVLETKRRSPFVKPWRMTAAEHRATFCPPVWADLAIGSGPCGYLCRQCYLLLTHRIWRDPRRHLIYVNYDDMEAEVRAWLLSPERRPFHTLGLGIDCSDSLLYEGHTGNARRFIPIFADPESNPRGCKLILLTKSANIHYLEGLPTTNVAVTFSLNPQAVCDAWEGVLPCDHCDGTGYMQGSSPKTPCSACGGKGHHGSMTPPIEARLLASRQAQQWGFETRWRIDPILPIANWEKHYAEFFREAAGMGATPRSITLGSYREKTPQLDTWREKWGLPPMDYQPQGLVKEGSHYHIPEEERRRIYEAVMAQIRRCFGDTVRVALCKETHALRRALGLSNASCNCLR
jgi:DNA repair photolyase